MSSGMSCLPSLAPLTLTRAQPKLLSASRRQQSQTNVVFVHWPVLAFSRRIRWQVAGPLQWKKPDAGTFQRRLELPDRGIAPPPAAGIREGVRVCYTSLLRNFPVVVAACDWADRPECFDALTFTDSASFSDPDSLASSLEEERLLLFAVALWDTCLWLAVA